MYGCIPGKITLMNSTFSCSFGVDVRLGPLCSDMLFVCENTHFYKNYQGFSLTVPTSHHEHKMEIVLHNVSYIDNNAAAMFLQNVQNVTIFRCYFKRVLHEGAIKATNSILSLVGNVTFMDNYSNYGSEEEQFAYLIF